MGGAVARATHRLTIDYGQVGSAVCAGTLTAFQAAFTELNVAQLPGVRALAAFNVHVRYFRYDAPVVFISIGLYMTRIGPLPTRLICSPTLKSGTSNGAGSAANHSVAAPNVSATNSWVPLPEMPPGVVLSTPWPISWPTTSSAPIQPPALLWPTATWVPS